jgi:hypothetical protein
MQWLTVLMMPNHLQDHMRHEMSALKKACEDVKAKDAHLAVTGSGSSFWKWR